MTTFVLPQAAEAVAYAVAGPKVEARSKDSSQVVMTSGCSTCFPSSCSPTAPSSSSFLDRLGKSSCADEENHTQIQCPVITSRDMGTILGNNRIKETSGKVGWRAIESDPNGDLIGASQRDIETQRLPDESSWNNEEQDAEASMRIPSSPKGTSAACSSSNCVADSRDCDEIMETDSPCPAGLPSQKQMDNNVAPSHTKYSFILTESYPNSEESWVTQSPTAPQTALQPNSARDRDRRPCSNIRGFTSGIFPRYDKELMDFNKVACEDTPAYIKDIIFSRRSTGNTFPGLTEEISFVGQPVSIPENQPGRHEASNVATTESGSLNMRSDIYSSWSGHDNCEGPVPGITAPKTHSWEDATEKVVRDTIRCLIKEKDMELSYISILSTINELRSKSDKDDSCSANPATNTDQPAPTLKRVRKLCSKLLRILTHGDTVRALFQETIRQNVVDLQPLSLQLYHAIQDAGLDLQDQDHFRMCQLLLEQQTGEEAFTCINKVDSARWNGPMYRAVISCHLLSKPRHLHEAELVLNQYLANIHNPTEKALILRWFKLQLDASKWEEIRAIYERRRARLVEAPRNIERISSAIPQLLKTPGEAKTELVPSTSHTFPFFSVFSKFNNTAPNASIEQSIPPQPSPKPNGDLNIQVNHRLTTLDNGILEECINHKQFEYGWKVYEGMSSVLEDRETAKIAMRLCKRAFLGHGGPGANQPGSPNLPAKDIRFEDELLTRDHDNGDESDDDSYDGSNHWNNKNEKSNLPPLMTSMQDDPEIWEARAWVIYNKATMDSRFFGPASPTGSPTKLQHPSGGTLTPTPSIAAVAGTASLTAFLHNTLTIAINSPERSSRFSKALRVYSHMRSDLSNQFQAQLRDPFVMTCMIKAIYDTVLVVAPRQEATLEDQRLKASPHHGSEAPKTDLQLQLHLQAMTIGPLIDLAFEIYADMRNVGPIRNLPHLCAKLPGNVTSSNHGPNSSNGSTGSISMLFHPSIRLPASSSLPSVGLSACNSPLSTESLFASSATMTDSDLTLQPLNHTLSPAFPGRRLPNELYLALLHLCTQVPLSGIQQSTQVVKTVVADMMATRSGQQPADLDRHLAAALQVFHDQWMCRPQELKKRSGEDSDERRKACTDSEGCIFHEWMYRPEEYVQEYMTVSNGSSGNTSLADFCGSGVASGSAPDPSRTSSSLSSNDEPDIFTMRQDGDDSPHYGISIHDAEFDEIDRYLGERATEALGDSRDGAIAHWIDGLDNDTCNGQFYWNLWDSEDPVLRRIVFSRRRARMLWRHIGSL